MKKLFFVTAAAAALAILFVFAGCGGKAGRKRTGGEVYCRLITDATGKDDKSFNAAGWRGILEFYGDTWDNPSKQGDLYDIVTCPSQDQYESTLNQAVDEDFDIIITTGFTFADATGSSAQKNPEQNYMIVDVDWVNQPNVLQAVFAEHEGSYLVGVAAALKAIEDQITNPRFGFIGGIAGNTITKFEVGYVQGILSVLPGAEIVDYYVNDWGAPDLAKTQAKNWYDSGVYIIYHAAGGSGGGLINQAKEYRLEGKNIWAIGVDSDQYQDGVYSGADSAVYTSMLKKVEAATLYALKAVKGKSFKGEVRTFDLKVDGVGYAATNPAMSAGIKAKVDEAAAQIKNGQIKVAATHADAKRLPGFPQNLKALDD